MLVGVAMALGLGADPWAAEQSPSSDKPTVTIQTTGVFEKGVVMGKTFVTVNFTSTPGKQAKHVVTGPVRYNTEGVVTTTGTGLEFLSLAEAKVRFKDMAGVTGLCTLDFDGSSYSCREGECKGQCKLHTKPAYCACQ